MKIAELTASAIELEARHDLDRPGLIQESDNVSLIDEAHGVDDAQPPELIRILEPIICTTKLAMVQEHTIELLRGDKLNSFIATERSSRSLCNTLAPTLRRIFR